MSNLDNKEQEFAKRLGDLTKYARRQGGTVSEDEIRDAFDELELSDAQYELIYEYLKKHNIGIGEAIDASEYLTKEEVSYLDNYLEELQLLEKLSDGEKEALIISAMAGESDAQKKLVEQSLLMVTDVAKLYAEQGVLIEDLVGEGNIALMKAVTELSTLESHKECDAYLAQRVMDAMESLIEDDAAETARAQKAVVLVQEVADKAKELADELRRSCTVEELAEETGMEVSRILEAIKACGNQIEDIDYKPEK
ncbi:MULTISPECIES: RNA polymerase sigma factor region1.1 domain-containing protein [unclassified Butyrivibrio]|uniref:RNA polymerase sigma factor region1.1 domain-containing protein n=1 Tax=unclassified Butyrivibrio TaxID=2639466 RepID=UPI0003F84544|nr:MULTISPECIES: RNA polymerase sigma factor region1.1 domain-containing protein [unclassified Butyrivibrio]